MVRYMVSKSDPGQCRMRRFLLAFSWTSGLITGGVISLAAGQSMISLMRMAAGCSVSIVSVSLTTILPFLLSAIAVFLSKPALLPVIAYGKATAFALISAAVFHSFGSAGWMVRAFLMFSEILSMPFLYGFWQRHISEYTALAANDLAYMAAPLLLCGLDFYCISPFLGKVLQY